MANKMKLLKYLPAILFASASTSKLFAQTVADSTSSVFTESFYQTEVVLFMLLLVVIVGLFLYFGWEKDEPVSEETVSAWAKFRQSMTKAVPVEEEDEILMEDDYDGIRELDNRIPPWFTYLFYATIIFGIYYMMSIYVFKTNKPQAQEYADEMRQADLKKQELMSSGNFINASNVKLLSDASSLEAGKTIFKSTCVPCHGPGGGGVVGPNLTDDYWIHGGGIKNIFTTIKNGVQAKGMPSWQNQFNTKQIQELASYVISLHGSNPSNAKPPQGDKYEEDQGK